MKSKYTRAVKQMQAKGWNTPDIIACIYDLFQNYYIDEDEENYLYNIVDPNEEYNDVWNYWETMNYKNPLMN